MNPNRTITPRLWLIFDNKAIIDYDLVACIYLKKEHSLIEVELKNKDNEIDRTIEITYDNAEAALKEYQQLSEMLLNPNGEQNEKS